MKVGYEVILSFIEKFEINYIEYLFLGSGRRLIYLFFLFMEI